MVLPDRIELSTSPLPMECSTTELRQHARYSRESAQKGATGGRFLPQGPRWRKQLAGPERVQNGQNWHKWPVSGCNPGGPRRSGSHFLLSGSGWLRIMALGRGEARNRRLRGVRVKHNMF